MLPETDARSQTVERSINNVCTNISALVIIKTEPAFYVGYRGFDNQPDVYVFTLLYLRRFKDTINESKSIFLCLEKARLILESAIFYTKITSNQRWVTSMRAGNRKEGLDWHDDHCLDSLREELL